MNALQRCKRLNFDQRNALYAYGFALALTAAIGILLQCVGICCPILFFACIFSRHLFSHRNRSELYTDGNLRFRNERVVPLKAYDTYATLTKVLLPVLLLGLLAATLIDGESRWFGFICFLLTFSYTTFLTGYLVFKNLPLITWTFKVVSSEEYGPGNSFNSATQSLGHNDFGAHMRHSPGFSHLPSNIHHRFH